jgi:hypothetical protein
MITQAVPARISSPATAATEPDNQVETATTPEPWSERGDSTSQSHAPRSFRIKRRRVIVSQQVDQNRFLRPPSHDPDSRNRKASAYEIHLRRKRNGQYLFKYVRRSH